MTKWQHTFQVQNSIGGWLFVHQMAVVGVVAIFWVSEKSRLWKIIQSI